MTQKTIIERKKEVRTVVPAVNEVITIDVPRIVWDCDFCARGSGDRMPSCLGCGKHACNFCLQKNKIFEEYEFEVGDAGYSGDSYSCYDYPASDDYRAGYFYLCPDCRKTPPEKIQDLMSHMKGLAELEVVVKEITNIILDDIERLRK
ncbi:MAG: hypothetical protein M0R80_03515 [Proteobacteria bacterium]|jgi:hypothetical protein|nr:hypothetical protein [Pseudomonadota bacterium]